MANNLFSFTKFGPLNSNNTLSFSQDNPLDEIKLNRELNNNNLTNLLFKNAPINQEIIENNFKNSSSTSLSSIKMSIQIKQTDSSGKEVTLIDRDIIDNLDNLNNTSTTPKTILNVKQNDFTGQEITLMRLDPKAEGNEVFYLHAKHAFPNSYFGEKHEMSFVHEKGGQELETFNFDFNSPSNPFEPARDIFYNTLGNSYSNLPPKESLDNWLTDLLGIVKDFDPAFNPTY